MYCWLNFSSVLSLFDVYITSLICSLTSLRDSLWLNVFWIIHSSSFSYTLFALVLISLRPMKAQFLIEHILKTYILSSLLNADLSSSSYVPTSKAIKFFMYMTNYNDFSNKDWSNGNLSGSFGSSTFGRYFSMSETVDSSNKFNE